MQIKGRYCVELTYRYYLDADSNENAVEQVLEIIDDAEIKELDKKEIMNQIVGES